MVLLKFKKAYFNCMKVNCPKKIGECRRWVLGSDMGLNISKEITLL